MITEEIRKELIMRTESHFWHHCCAIDDEECYATHEEEARVEMGLTRDQVSEILAVEFPLVGKCWDEWRKTAPAEQANDHSEDHRLCLDGGEECPTSGDDAGENWLEWVHKCPTLDERATTSIAEVEDL